MIHLISEDLVFNEEFKSFFENQGFFPEDGKIYQTLGIIGCQSSGKSTLLNHLFGTNFEIMNESEGRTQTTKGIWLALNKEFNVILFDVEGTDSKERGDNRLKFEQCSSLFTLAMSDVLLINMWTSDIGRYTASNYGVLKVVFELNLRLFQQDRSEKKIVIVLRDFNSETDEINKLRPIIMEDMKHIWEEISKPDMFKDKQCEEFFKFEFLTLAHKFYKEKEFLEDCEKIKKRLIRKKDDYKTGANLDSIFNLINYDKNVPVDGLYKYAMDMWTSILNNKDLNIPGQKEMLAMFKCEEIKALATNSVEININELELASSSQTLEDFKERVESINNKAMEFYDATAKNYLPHIYLEIRNKLAGELANKMYSSFANQLKRLIPKYQKDFRNEFTEKLKKDENFYKVSEELKKKYLEIFEQQIKNICVYDSWESGKDNGSLLEEVIEDQKRICLEDKKEKIIEKFNDFIDDIIANKFELISPNFWEEFEQEIFQLISENLLAQRLYLIDIYRLTNEEVKPFLIDCENEVYQIIKSLFLKQLPTFPNTQIENFKKDFWYNDGIPREWNKMAISRMNELFYSTSEKYKNTFELLKQLKVIPHLLEFCDYDVTSKDVIDNIINNKIKEKLNDPQMKFEQLVNDTTLKGYINKYEDGINEVYEDAKKRHDNIKSSSIPLWAWVLLFYVGYQDVWKIFSGYWLLILLLLLGIYTFLNVMGLGNAPFLIYNLISNQIKNMLNK